MSLDVYLKAQRIGMLSPQGENGYSFTYEPEVVARGKAGEPLLSHSLPLREEPFTPVETRAYVEGLLPEGERRERIAHELCLDPGDGYALIAELGRDCPGAVTFLPEGEAPQPLNPEFLAWLEEDELEELLTVPRGLFDPAHEQRMRFTLPGERHKLALIHDPDTDRWAWPEPGAPSTHIVKPQGEEHPNFAINEMACTTALREMGLPVAHAELAMIAGHPCLVSRRFDRWGEGANAERLHQESFNQALGIAPGEEPGTVIGFGRSHDLLKSIGEKESIETFFRVAFCNYLIGNGDIQSKNSALLFTDTGPILAPFYDIASTAIYEPARAADNLVDLVSESSCLAGMARIAIPCDMEFLPTAALAFETMTRFAEALGGVAERAQEEGWHAAVIEQILLRVFDQVGNLREEMNNLRPPGTEPL